MSHNQLVNYMSNLATQNIATKDFFRFNIAEIQGALKSGITFPCLAMESHEGNFEGSTPNNSIEQKIFAFSILDKPTSPNNFDSENEVLDNCELIGKQFLARMRYDARNPASILYNAFDVVNVNYHKVGPLYMDKLFGYRFEVALKPATINLKPDHNHWSDITDSCP